MVIFLGDSISCLSGNQTWEDSTCDFDLLRKVDPASANRIHPNNIRKVSVFSLPSLCYFVKFPGVYLYFYICLLHVFVLLISYLRRRVKL